jgi:ATP-dependent DNA ligase
MTTVFETPLLVAEASKGNAKFWQGRVVTDGTDFFTQTTSYQSTKDGGTSTPLVSVPKRIEPKNVGKANETTPRDQAIAEITSDEKKKRDKGYYDHGQAAPERLPLPMLAHSYKDRHRDMKWPCYVQPKLDGTRMLFDGKKGWSRQGKPYIPEVIEHLTVTLPYVDKRPLILDGELMLDHTQFSFQDTMTAIKKYRSDISPQLTYFIYDVLMEGVPFEERLRILEDITRPRSDEDLTRVLDFSGIGLEAVRRAQIVMVPTFKAASFEEVKLWHERFIEAGFEGTMLRNTAGLYKVDHRSADLLKHKDFTDEEFLIVGVEQGVAKEEGCAIFVCQSHHATAAGAASIFNVRPKGTDAQRRELYAMREKLIGQRLKVKYQNLSDTGIPRFPVGIVVREAWDLSPDAGNGTVPAATDAPAQADLFGGGA